MNVFDILDKIEKFDGDAYDRVAYTSRRFFLNKISSRVAAAAAPAVLAGSLNKAYAQSADAVNVLQFALTLEYLEAEFYELGNNEAGLIPDMYKPVFKAIGDHEKEHVTFLLTALKSAANPKPAFDFTAGGQFAPFKKFDDFVFLSHAFEDTGVRAYKGQAGRLINDDAILEAALQIHSAEARHASISRRILGKIRNNASIKGWITNDEGSPAPVYKGEDVVVQAGANLLDLPLSEIPEPMRFKAITEAFDEILTMQEATDIAMLFIKKM